MYVPFSPFSLKHVIIHLCLAAYLAYEAPAISAAPVWQLSLPHVATATLAAVLFGYHMG